MTTTKTRASGNAPGLSALPPPATLPGLPAAFSRRRVIFGAVAVAAASGAILGASEAGAVEPAALDPADARLIDLAATYEALDRKVNATLSTDPGYDALIDRYGPLEEEIVETPAASMVGVMVKVRLCRMSVVRDSLPSLPLSIADDLARLHGVAAITAAPPRLFNPAAYIADLRAAGVRVRPLPDSGTYAMTAPPGRGLGAAYGDVQEKWARARDEDVDPVGRVFHTLMAEA